MPRPRYNDNEKIAGFVPYPYKNVSAQRTLPISTLNSSLSTLSVLAARAIKISPTVAVTTDKSLQKWYSINRQDKIPFGCNKNLLLFFTG